MHESLGETSKNESLADDNTTLMEFTEVNLRNLRKILEDFGSISGSAIMIKLSLCQLVK